MKTAKPVPCGTLRGHQYHVRAGERPCMACRRARNAYDRGRYVRRLVPEPCGTDGAYQRHLRSGEETCQACRAAHAEQGRASRERAADRDLFDRMLVETWMETA